MLIEQSLRALIIKPISRYDHSVAKIRYFVVEMKKYSFNDEHCLGGYVQRDDLKEVTLAEISDFSPDIYFYYDSDGSYRRIFLTDNCHNNAIVNFVLMLFRSGELRFDLENYVVDDDVLCDSQLRC
ncbi:MAG: hypothetical protein WC663_05700 [Patescibacteria group bacterium]